MVLRGSTSRGGSGWPAACRARCVGARKSEPTGSPEESNCLEASTALRQPIDLRRDMPSHALTDPHSRLCVAHGSKRQHHREGQGRSCRSWCAGAAIVGEHRSPASAVRRPSALPQGEDQSRVRPKQTLAHRWAQRHRRRRFAGHHHKCGPGNSHQRQHRTSVGYRVYVPLSRSRCVWSYRAHSATPLGWWRLGLLVYGALSLARLLEGKKPTPGRWNYSLRQPNGIVIYMYTILRHQMRVDLRDLRPI